MKIKYKQRLSTISPISTQRKINSHLKALNTKRQGHILLDIQGQAKHCGRAKLVI